MICFGGISIDFFLKIKERNPTEDKHNKQKQKYVKDPTQTHRNDIL